MRKISAAIQFTGAPKPLNRPCTITNRSGFVLQRCWEALNKIEAAFTSRGDVSAVLNVVGRPITLGSRVVAFIKECVKSFKDKRLVFGFCSLTHFLFSIVCRAAVKYASTCSHRRAK